MRLLIGLGGNQGAVQDVFSLAVASLAAHVDVVSRSAVWRSEAQGPPQPDYLNAAILVETGIHPHEILSLCRGIEADAGRDRARERRFGPRPLDLDLLLAPGLVIETPSLTLPHPRLAERRFALAPAAELAPEWVHPRALLTLAELAGAPAVAAQRCELVAALRFGA